VGLVAIPIALALAGTATSVVGQVKAGKAQKAAGEAQAAAAESEAQIQDFNATVADQQAQDAIARGQQDEQRYRSQVRGLLGSQRAGFAGANVDVDFGSSVDVQADAAQLGELDALQIRTNAAREAWGYSVSATDYRNRAAVARKEGVNLDKAGQAAASASYVSAAGTILGTSTSLLFSKYPISPRK